MGVALRKSDGCINRETLSIPGFGISIPPCESMNTETYLNHPTFGLLFRVCLIDENQELYTTLYAQRIFFLVNNSPSGLSFEPISRSDARLMVESRMRLLRRTASSEQYNQLHAIHQQTFL